MATAENKVVSLEFNNSRFAGAVQDTMSALDKLKEKLSFKGAKQGFGDIQASADKVQMNNISRGIEGVSKGFIAMSTIAVTAISRITSSIMDMASRLSSAVSLQPLKDGFAEFELGMKSTQTILANTKDAGENLETVSAALTELNEYSDKTIYNFGQMAANIGKMTAAGVPLQGAVDAVKGLSNVAALFGADAQSAASATYQLSQAMSTGFVRAQDWMSVDNASMGGKAFTEALFETGKALGTLKDVEMGTTFDEWKKSSGGFRASLESGWLTTDVLNTTLKGFTGDYTAAQLVAMGYSDEQAMKMEELGKRATESATDVLTFTQLLQVTAEAMGTGWSDSFKLIFGDFAEAKKLFSSLNGYISGIIGRSADARNEALEGWKAFGGREALLEGFLYLWEDILSVLRPVGEAFREIFPRKTAGDLLVMTDKFRSFFRDFKIGEGVISAIKGVFTVFFSVLKGGMKVVGFLATAFFKIVGAVGAFVGAVAKAGGGAIKAFFGAIGNLFKTLAGGAGSAAKGALDGISSGAAKLGSFVGNLAQNLSVVTEWINNFVKSLKRGGSATDSADKKTSKFAGVIEFLKGVMSGIGDFFSNLFGGVQNVGDFVANLGLAIVDGLSNLGSRITGALGEVFNAINWNTVIGGVGVGAGAALMLQIRNFLKGIDLDNYLQEIAESINDVLDAAANALNSFSLSVKAEAIMKIAIAVAVLTAALVVLAAIDPKKLAQAGAAMAGMFGALNLSLKQMMSLQLPSGAQMVGLAGVLIGMSVAILLLSAAMKRIGDLDMGDISAGLTSIGALMAGLTKASVVMRKETGTLARAGLAMVGMSVAIYILTFSLARLASIDPGAAVAGAVAVAIAMYAMAKALKTIDEKESLKKGLGFTALSVGITIFAKAVEMFGTMPISTLIRGFAAIGLGLFGMTKFFNMLPANLPQIAMEMLVISFALIVLSKAVESFGKMDIGTMLKGFIGVAGGLMIMAMAANVMNSAIVGAGAILVVSVALTALAAAVSTFGQMGVDTMVKGILGIAAALLVIAGAAALIGYISPLILAGGAAFLVLGAGMLLFGAGAWLAATAIIALSGATLAGVATSIAALMLFAAALPMMLKAFAKGFAEAVPEMVNVGVILVMALLEGLIKIIPKVFEVLGKLVDGLVPWLGVKAPVLIALGVMLIRNFLKGVVQTQGEIVRSILEMIQNTLSGIRDSSREFARTGLEIVDEFVRGILEGLVFLAEDVVNGMIDFMNGLAELIEERSEEVGEAGRRLAKAIINGIIDALIPEDLQEKIGELVGGMVDKFKSMLGIASPSKVFSELGKNILDGLLEGLGNAVESVLTFFRELPGKILRAIGDVASTLFNKGVSFLWGMLRGAREKLIEFREWMIALPGKLRDAIVNIKDKLLQKGRDFIQGLRDGASERLEQVKTYVSNIPGSLSGALGDTSQKLLQKGRDFVQGLKNGINEKWDEIKSWLGTKVDQLVEVITNPLEIFSPSRVTRRLGNYFVDGLKIGMEETWGGVETTAANGTQQVLSAVAKALSDFEAIGDLNPIITPVLDLSLVEAQARTLGDILGIDSLATEMSYINAQDIATTSQEQAAGPQSVDGGNTYVTLEQNNYSPKALSTADIYRGQKSQIALARRELGLVDR